MGRSMSTEEGKRVSWGWEGCMGEWEGELLTVGDQILAEMRKGEKNVNGDSRKMDDEDCVEIGRELEGNEKVEWLVLKGDCDDRGNIENAGAIVILEGLKQNSCLKKN
eukprot:TRINITY_DN1565_c1_g1_i6.p2 TRINITY_DN1565_c1_g1~~TRINITY_DN1565_c1_g1_i6.p2  ORF type:complete len:108 (-),score=12.90 TRINITY_DN1565_c1_g1_i6:13-336(-)